MEDASPSDHVLMKELIRGQQAALRLLMDRHDRLVRYAIFRASPAHFRRDPQWVESLASATWAGFVQSLQRRDTNRPNSVRGYLVRIARNQVNTELRRAATSKPTLDREASISLDGIKAQVDEPLELLSRLENLEALRRCVSRLSREDQALMGQLSAITDRRWVEAAAALGMSESTLRSRWRRTLSRLRRCLESNRTGFFFAHQGSTND